ncbi:MAG: hypothetical protein AUI14_18685 [Actinobacteria bacterium 13_2_20CM_2_71_6]|nr:MAG: hypothetical protein AUI14_18685 [Actinobacteria bacterium 13_2_20CM_2_71_6]
MTPPSPAGYPVRLAAARAALADLDLRIGTPGLAAAAALPGLLAEVDQHAAALRDLLGDGERAPSPIGLAGYADGLRDMASGLGWHLPQSDRVDWARAPWLLVRLVAVCQLAVPPSV